MLTYLFLLAAAATPAELPTITLTETEQQEIQELVALFTQADEIASDITTVTAAAPSVSDETSVAVSATPITITNAIEPDMLEYPHWTGKYSPEKFTVSINGTEVAQGKTVELPATTKTVEIRYDYSFMNGMYVGGKTISYEFNEKITEAHITFSWKNDWRIIVDNAVARKEVL